MNRETAPGRLPRERTAVGVSTAGVVLTGLLVCWWIAFRSTLEPTDIVVSFATVGLPALGLVWGGRRLERSDVEPERYGRIGRWAATGSVGFLFVNLVFIALYPWYGVTGDLIWAHWAVTIGAVGGFAIGFVEARAIQREVEATAATVRAEQLEAEREVLEYLNDRLRHEVLNSSQIIGGHASLVLSDEPDPETQSRLETIRDESDELADVIGDVRALIDATKQTDGPSVVDLSAVLEYAIDVTRVRYEDAEITLETSDSELAAGDDGLVRLFSTLLENAVEHDGGETPHVDVTAELTREMVVVTVSDDGPEIDAERRAQSVDRQPPARDDSLYLPRLLANRYDGTVELAETDPDGTTVVVTLPRVSDPETEPLTRENIGRPLR